MVKIFNFYDASVPDQFTKWLKILTYVTAYWVKIVTLQDNRKHTQCLEAGVETIVSLKKLRDGDTATCDITVQHSIDKFAQFGQEKPCAYEESFYQCGSVKHFNFNEEKCFLDNFMPKMQ